MISANTGAMLYQLPSHTLGAKPQTSMYQMTLLAMSRESCSVFCGKTKETKIKREGLYQDYGNGGLRMTDIVTMIKALRLA